jgi:hypothetical protein
MAARNMTAPFRIISRTRSIDWAIDWAIDRGANNGNTTKMAATRAAIFPFTGFTGKFGAMRA